MQNIFREFVFILFDRMRLVVMVFLTVFIISTAIAVTLPSIYRSMAKFSLVIPQGFDPLQQESSYDYRSRMRRYLQDQKELIMSNRVLEKALQILNPGTNQPAPINLIDEIRKNLDVLPPEGETFENSNVFNVIYINSDPLKAANVARAVTQGYLDTFNEFSQSKTDYSLSFFEEQKQRLYKDMVEKEKKLRDFETKKALVLLEILNTEGGKANFEVGPNALLTQFLRSYHELQIELAGLNTAIESIDRELGKKGIPVVPPEMETPGRSIQVFKSKVSSLQIQLNEMRLQFKENYEPLKQVEQELHLNVDALKKELERSVSAQKISAHSIESRIRQLEKIINDLKEQIQATARGKVGYEDLKQEFYLAKDAYSRIVSQLEQARMAHSLKQEKQYLTLIDKPMVPTKPFKPNRILIAIGGLISGIFLGIAIALTVDHFDHRIKTLYDIETHLKVPVLGSIPSV